MRMGTSPKLEWMYKGVAGLVEREEYLLGRKIDKTFEIIQNEEQKKGHFEFNENDVIPDSIFTPKGSAHSDTVTVDLKAKMREDPLFDIRKKQNEQKRNFMDNPIKMKRLKNLLEKSLMTDKKKKRVSNDSSDSSDSSDDTKRKNTKMEYRKRYDELRANDKSHHKQIKHIKESPNKRDEKRHDSSRDRKSHTHRESRHTNDRSSHRDNSKSRVESFRKESGNVRKKLSAEDSEKRLKQMIDNAVWREMQRKDNVNSYADEQKKESDLNESGKSAEFIKPLLKKASDINSLEDRLKQKRFTSQRSYNAMDKNFARK